MSDRSEVGGRRSEIGAAEIVADESLPASESESASMVPTSDPRPPTIVSRRRALQVLGIVPVAASMGMLPQQQQQQQQQPAQQQPRQPPATPNQPAQDTTQPERNASQPRSRFFTAKEMRTVRVLADDIFPRDARSPSATAVGVPAFIDFHLSVEETSKDDRLAWRGGLRWLDRESRKRFGAAYAAASRAQRHQILDDISFPNGVPANVTTAAALAGLPPTLRPGAAFFARARDMVAAGFFSSPDGWKDLRYMGNTAVPEWRGCPAPALAKLGVSYAEYDASLARRRSSASND